MDAYRDKYGKDQGMLNQILNLKPHLLDVDVSELDSDAPPIKTTTRASAFNRIHLESGPMMGSSSARDRFINNYGVQSRFNLQERLVAEASAQNSARKEVYGHILTERSSSVQM